MTGRQVLVSPFSDFEVVEASSLLNVPCSLEVLVSCCRRDGLCGPSFGELLVELVFVVPP